MGLVRAVAGDVLVVVAVAADVAVLWQLLQMTLRRTPQERTKRWKRRRLRTRACLI